MIGDVFVGCKYGRVFGYLIEDVQMIIESMVLIGKEFIFCMGDDILLVVFLEKVYLLYDYFKQCFVQVYIFNVVYLFI